VHGDLRFADLGHDHHYDVIFCAEVLYYISKRDAPNVCRQLDRYLAVEGVIIMVTGVSPGKHDEFFFEEWEEILCKHFSRVFKEIVQGQGRPYRIIVFARR
jgi:chemotaxis methyl-accepting protein methylase